MQNSRETIYSALFSLLQGAYPWAYSSRAFRMWGDVATGEQPAMFLRQRLEVSDQAGQNAGMTRWHLKTHVWIYLQANPNTDEPGNYPSQTLNPILDALELAIRGNIPGQKQNLAAYNGGVPLVERVWIDGPILINDPESGVLQIIAAVPVTVTTGF